MKKKLLVLLVGLFSVLVFAKPVQAKEAFTIEEYNIDVTVTESGEYQIEETIWTDFTTARHGIYRYIPEKYIMNFDGESHIYNFGVNDVMVYKDDFETDSEDGYKIIKIGSENELVYGEHKYRFSYIIRTYDLGLEDKRQLFYLNFIGDGWDTTIDDVRITVHFPKPVENRNSLEVYSTKVESRWVDDTTLVIDSLEALVPHESVTAYLQLENDYLHFPDYSSLIYSAIGICAAILAFFALLYFRYGKDEPLEDKTLFEPPVGIDPAAVGYIVDDNVEQRDILSLLLHWGQMGFIHMEEDNYGDISIVKEKELDGDVPDYQLSFFRSIFEKKNVVSLSDVSTDFMKAYNQCKTDILKHFKKGPTIYTPFSRNAQILSVLVGSIPFGVILGLAAYAKTYRGELIILNVCISFVIVLMLNMACVVLREYWYVLKRYYRNFWSIVIAVFTVVILAVYYLIEKEYVALKYFVLAILITVAFMLISIPMRKRTAYGQKVLSEILGFRKFILNFSEADYDRMEKEDPNYYYRVLPYAYALGLVDVWLGHFEDRQIEVPPCHYYYYQNRRADRFFTSHVKNSMNSISRSINEKAYSSSSGGSNGSSSGGFSGGGFGGGGGGSW